ncbi:MAG: AAA-like domain-containing protein, partial [Cyanobacteria bacterium P01_D01_bin.56]
MTTSSSFNSANIFQTGGSLRADASTYVERSADATLYESILFGEFCYILNSRQMGKSSLRVRTMQRLKAAGCTCAAIDITRIGSQQIQAPRWYAGLIRSLSSSFGLTQTINLRSWLREHEYLTPIQQLGEFIESVLLVEIETPIVIFIDEIDSVLSLDFPTDDLFTFIRACYNQRVDNSEYNRLTFVLLGVATPADLVSDKTRTPFNVGCSIELSGLTIAKSYPLVTALGTRIANPEEVLRQILDWTKGQPFLTQRLCRLITECSEVGTALPLETVDGIIWSQVIDNWESHDDQDHLRTIQGRILQNEHQAGRLLGLYQQILQNGSLTYDGSPEHMELRLSGLVVAHQGYLEVYNRIYQSVFDERWVDEALNRLRPYAATISAWLGSNRQDDSRLLRGQALADAQAWAIGKSLSTQDYEFLAASRELDLQEIQATLEVQQEANQILESANQTAKNRLGVSFAGASVAVALALIAGSWAFKAGSDAQRAEKEARQAESELITAEENLTTIEQNMAQAQEEAGRANQAEEAAKQAEQKARQALSDAEAQRVLIEQQTQQELAAADQQVTTAQQLAEQARIEQQNATQEAAQARREQGEAVIGTRLERTGTAAFRLFEVSELIALLEAVRAGITLQTLVQNTSKIEDYPTVSPLLALQSFLGRIREKNRFIPNDFLDASLLTSSERVGIVSQENIQRTWGNLTTTEEVHRLRPLQQVEMAQLRGRVDSLSYLYPYPELIGLGKTQHESWFSPDGQYVVTEDFDDVLRLWNVNGSEIAELSEGEISDTNTNQSDFQIISRGIIETSRLTILEPIRLIQQYQAELPQLRGRVDALEADVFPPEIRWSWMDIQNNADDVLFDPSSEWLVTISKNRKEIEIWAVDGQRIGHIENIENPIEALEFEIENGGFATYHSNGSIQLWSKEGSQIRYLSGSSIEIDSIAGFNLNNKWLVRDEQPNVISDFSGQEIFRVDIAAEEQSYDVYIGFAPGKQYLFTFEPNSLVRFWDHSGVEKASFLDVKKLAFSSSGEYILTQFLDDSTKVWRNDGSEVIFLNTSTTFKAAGVSPDGQKVVVVDEENNVMVSSLQGKQLLNIHIDKLLSSLTFNANGGHLAIQYWIEDTEQFLPENSLAGQRLWDVDFTLQQTFVSEISQCLPLLESLNRELINRSVRRSIDEKHDRCNPTVPRVTRNRVWEFDTYSTSENSSSGQELNISSGGTERFKTLSFSPDYAYMIAVGEDDIFKLWNLTNRN